APALCGQLSEVASAVNARFAEHAESDHPLHRDKVIAHADDDALRGGERLPKLHRIAWSEGCGGRLLLVGHARSLPSLLCVPGPAAAPPVRSYRLTLRRRLRLASLAADRREVGAHRLGRPHR